MLFVLTLCSCCSVSFSNPEHAIMVMNALSVDKEVSG